VWRVKVQDNHGSWGDWSLEQSFFIRGLFSPAAAAPPGGDRTGVVVTEPVTFTWKFRDPDPKDRSTRLTSGGGWCGAGGGDHQRCPDDEGWFVLRGAGDVPGTKNQWQFASGYFIPGNLYEWQVRTYDQPARLVPSGWSASGYFMAVGTPGSAIEQAPEPDMADIQGELGCGTTGCSSTTRAGWSG
jgi:hypothetical protein